MNYYEYKDSCAGNPRPDDPGHLSYWTDSSVRPVATISQQKTDLYVQDTYTLQKICLVMSLASAVFAGMGIAALAAGTSKGLMLGVSLACLYLSYNVYQVFGNARHIIRNEEQYLATSKTSKEGFAILDADRVREQFSRGTILFTWAITIIVNRKVRQTREIEAH